MKAKHKRKSRRYSSLSKSTDEARELLIREYEYGSTASELSRASGFSKRSISQYLRSQMANRKKHRLGRAERESYYKKQIAARKGSVFFYNKRQYVFNAKNYRRMQKRKLKLEFDKAKHLHDIPESRFIFHVSGSP